MTDEEWQPGPSWCSFPKIYALGSAGLDGMEVNEDTKDDIKVQLWKHFEKTIIRRCTSGVPAWYKEKLASGELS